MSENQTSNKATYFFLAVAVIAMAVMLSYVLNKQAPILKLDSLQKQAERIVLLPENKQEKAKNTFLSAVSKQLKKESKIAKPEIARLGLKVASEYNDDKAQLKYLEYLNKHLLLEHTDKIQYAALLYVDEGKLTPELEALIASVLSQDAKQADMMLILGQEALDQKDYTSATHALEIAVDQLQGESQQTAKALLKETQLAVEVEEAEKAKKAAEKLAKEEAEALALVEEKNASSTVLEVSEEH